MPIRTRRQERQVQHSQLQQQKQSVTNHVSEHTDYNKDKLPLSAHPDLGLPTSAQYQHLEKAYLDSLSHRKREKALLSQEMFDNIWDVLHDPMGTKVCNAQFRWWVRKMFVLGYSAEPTPPGDNLGSNSPDGTLKPIVLHENRPVAVKSNIYDILCFAHMTAQHGGRDKTASLVRKHYSWIPKELIAKFVKACPTCQFKKSSLAQIRRSGISKLLCLPDDAKAEQVDPPRIADMTTKPPENKEDPHPFGDLNSVWALRTYPSWLHPTSDNATSYFDPNTTSCSPTIDTSFSPLPNQNPFPLFPTSDTRSTSPTADISWLSDMAIDPILPPIRQPQSDSQNTTEFPPRTHGPGIRLPSLVKALSGGEPPSGCSGFTSGYMHLHGNGTMMNLGPGPGPGLGRGLPPLGYSSSRQPSSSGISLVQALEGYSHSRNNTSQTIHTPTSSSTTIPKDPIPIDPILLLDGFTTPPPKSRRNSKTPGQEQNSDQTGPQSPQPPVHDIDQKEQPIPVYTSDCMSTPTRRRRSHDASGSESPYRWA